MRLLEYITRRIGKLNNLAANGFTSHANVGNVY